MTTLSNCLTMMRAPLAFLFCQENNSLRIFAICMAIITDSIDGYIARRSKSESQFGAILDPIMDKFFVLFALTVLFIEGKVAPFEMTAMLSRDVALFFYGTLMFAMGRLQSITVRAFRWGKISTALQFFVLMGICCGFTIPWYIFGAFIAMGVFSFFELLQRSERHSMA